MATKSYSEMRTAIKKVNLENSKDLSALDSLKILEHGNISSYYIPFDYVSEKAKVVLVGITPGKTQLFNALSSVQRSLMKGLEQEDVLKIAKNEGAFSGTLRKNLIKLLDHIGLHEKLGISSTSSLFDKDAYLVHTTSVLRHPVFINGKDYSGSTPNMLKHPLLRDMIDAYLMEEINKLPKAIYIPLGPKVSQVFEYLIQQGSLQDQQVLFGLPHPSGANAERIAYFLGNKARESLSLKTNPDLLDQAKLKILEKLSLNTN
ncbi:MULTISPECIES: uracil-DNA glycosylase family protein [Acinetobacter calcoaceticus/baumannii complex]|uniref:uracil-DNA glycosylase family protein n=1 Tax=Acinetobacter calcoaceticus/baumannii complex TaxID=909768 RepID=UPI0023D85170|nr:uracil-DNA glycosylase family protein [Acinetobacter nosocomialis]MDF0627101.1 uracil-DNA glycosylase family protein [Acinetobacter nosocomialis]